MTCKRIKTPLSARGLGVGTLLTALWMLGMSSAAVADQPVQRPDSIRQTVRQFLVDEVAKQHNDTPRIRVGRLDPRLRLKKCGSPLEATVTGTGRLIGATSVRVHCAGPSPWSIYVSAQVTVFGKVLVTTRALSRGDTLRTGDVQLARRDLSALPYGYMTNPAQANGMVMRRSVRTGAVLRPNQLMKPKLIRRGQQVTITAASGTVQVHMAGKALGDAAEGETVQVRNSSSRRVIEGIAVSSGVVQVHM